MAKKTTNILFTGTPIFTGGLTNEQELAGACPESFTMDNEWVAFAKTVTATGIRVAEWRWRTKPGFERLHQVGCLLALLGSTDLSQDKKWSIAGWMLSEMLEVIPTAK